MGKLTSIIFSFAFFLISTVSVFAHPVKTLTTDNGIEFYFMKMEGEDRTSFDMVWQSDWLGSDANNPLVPFLGTRLIMVSGAGDLGAAELQKRFNNVDADSSVTAAVDNVRGRLTVANQDLDEVVGLANIVLTQAALDERWMFRIADKLDEDYALQADITANLGWDAVRRKIFGTGQIYNFLSNVGGMKFADIAHKDVVDWYKSTFVLEGLQIVVTGDHSEQKAKELVANMLAGMPDGKKKQWKAPLANYQPGTIVLYSPRAEKTTLGYVAPLPSTRSALEYEQITAVHLLGGNEQSRLFKAVRDELRASYGFSSGLGNFSRENRYLYMLGEVEFEKLLQVRQSVRAAYGKFLKEGPQADEVQALKVALTNNVDGSSAHAGYMSFAIAESLLDNKPADRALRLKDEVARMSVETVMDELQSTFPQPDALLELIVTPHEIDIEGACVISQPEKIDNCR